MCINHHKETLNAVAKDLYSDLAKPVAKETGKLISLIPRAIKASLLPVEKWILNREYSLKEAKKLLENKLSNVSPERITVPEAYIAVPAINALSYSSGSIDLIDLYANLLATSMIEDNKWDVHPSFVEIIKQLLPDEAKLLKEIASHEGENEFPLISLEMKKQENNSFSYERYVKVNNFTNIGDNVCDIPEKTITYIDNLVRLRIIDIHEDESASGYNYTELEKHDFIENFKSSHSVYDGFEWGFKHYMFKVTQFGFDFIDICVLGKKIN